MPVTQESKKCRFGNPLSFTSIYPSTGPSEITLCNMFAQNNIRVAYEAKVNRAVFDYANNSKLTERDNKGNYTTLDNVIINTKGKLAQYGGICSTDPTLVSCICSSPHCERGLGCATRRH
jgi:hypothetical protein